MVKNEFRNKFCTRMTHTLTLFFLIFIPYMVKSQILFDPNMSKGTTFSTVFSDSQIIPLETNKESLFGDISIFKLHKDNFYIFDSDTRSILIFKNTGKFIAKISSKSIKDKENKNVRLMNYGIDKINQRLIVYFNDDSKMAIFNFEGKFLKFEEFDAKFAGIFLHNAYYLSDYITSYKTKSFDRLRKISKNNIERFDTVTNFNGDLMYYNSNLYNSDLLLYTKSLDNNIYIIEEDKIDTLYKFIFPLSLTFPQQNYINNFLNISETIKKYPNSVYSITDTYLINKYFFFKIKSYHGFANEDCFIYDNEKEEFYSIFHLQQDSLSKNIPFPLNKKGSSFSRKNILSVDNEYVYLHFASNEFISNTHNTTNAIKEFDNPVIIKLKIRLNE